MSEKAPATKYETNLHHIFFGMTKFVKRGSIAISKFPEYA
jgi:hypothetical protein